MSSGIYHFSERGRIQFVSCRETSTFFAIMKECARMYRAGFILAGKHGRRRLFVTEFLQE